MMVQQSDPEPVPAGQHISCPGVLSGPAAFCMVVLTGSWASAESRLSHFTSVQLMAFLAGVLSN